MKHTGIIITIIITLVCVLSLILGQSHSTTSQNSAPAKVIVTDQNSFNTLFMKVCEQAPSDQEYCTCTLNYSTSKYSITNLQNMTLELDQGTISPLALQQYRQLADDARGACQAKTPPATYVTVAQLNENLSAYHLTHVSFRCSISQIMQPPSGQVNYLMCADPTNSASVVEIFVPKLQDLALLRLHDTLQVYGLVKGTVPGNTPIAYIAGNYLTDLTTNYNNYSKYTK